MELPLIRLLPQTPSPRGEGLEQGIDLDFKQVVTIRYKTGDARPPGGRLGTRLIIFAELCNSKSKANNFIKKERPCDEKSRKGDLAT